MYCNFRVGQPWHWSDRIETRLRRIGLPLSSRCLRICPNDGTMWLDVTKRLLVLPRGLQMPCPYLRICHHGEARDAMLVPKVDEVLSCYMGAI